MKILHTSDWHLGRDFGPVSLHADQAAFIDWLVDEVGRRGIELVVIAGDIYDRAYAPNDAVVLFRTALQRLLDAGAKVAAITGNHDAADRVANYGNMLDGGRLFVRGGYEAIGEVITAKFDDGPLDLVMLPFLDPQAAPDWLGVDDESAGEDGADAEAGDAFTRRIKRTHHSVLQQAVAAAVPRLSAPRSLAVSHAFVVGGEVSDSERQLVVGGTGTVTAEVFSPFSYTALGHLHRPQTIPGYATVRYSGTPLAYSFSEAHPKSVSVIEMALDGTFGIEEVLVPVGRAVHTITGLIDELLQARPTADTASKFVRAVLTDPGVVLDAKQRLSAVYPHILEIELRPTNADGTPFVTSVAALDRQRLSPAEIADQFWLDSTGSPATERQQRMVHVALHDASEQVA
jgi:exonuclease SbcD